MKTTIVLLFAFLLSDTFSFSQSNATKEVKTDRKLIQKEGTYFDWKAFDKTSKISIDSINPIVMQGLWKAYKGLFKFGDMVNSMNLTQPFIIEVHGGKMRRSSDSEFETFTLNKNQLASNSGQDNGAINKITETLLVITWENNRNLTRYYYEKE